MAWDWSKDIGSNLAAKASDDFVSSLPDIDFSNKGPQRVRAFLRREEAGTGYLAPAQRSLEFGSAIRGVYEQGRQGFQDTVSALSSSGLSRRYAVPIAVQEYQRTGNLASEMLAAGMGETNRRRFDAMRAYLDMLNQSKWASKIASANYELGKAGAAASVYGGTFAGVAAGAGSLTNLMPFGGGGGGQVAFPSSGGSSSGNVGAGTGGYDYGGYDYRGP